MRAAVVRRASQVAAGLVVLLAVNVHAQTIDAVVAHPPFRAPYSCSEHALGELKGLGDELGQDCVIFSVVAMNGRLWPREYRNLGRENTDWYGWNQPVLSPCACQVVAITTNPVTNQPGIIGKPPATYISLRRDDGVHFLLAHVQELSVDPNEWVTYGQPIARVGNNGYSRSPHVHIGAWKDNAPLQIRWDLGKRVSP